MAIAGCVLASGLLEQSGFLQSSGLGIVTGVASAIVFGIFIYAETPSVLMLVGLAVVILALALLWNKERGYNRIVNHSIL